jgi:hypothetical protein
VYLKTRKRWIFRKHKQDLRQRVTGILCGFQGFLRQNPTMFVEIDYGNTAQFPPYGLSTAPAAAARHLRCQNAR